VAFQKVFCTSSFPNSRSRHKLYAYYTIDSVVLCTDNGLYRVKNYPFKAWRFLYVPPGLTLRNSTWCSLCLLSVLYGSQHRQRPFLYTSLPDWFL